MKKTSIFILEAIEPVAEQDDIKGHYVKDANGNVKCRVERAGTYSSVKKAEAAMRKMIDAESKERDSYGFWTKKFGYVIDELYLDDNLDKYGYPSEFESRRTYLGDGTLNCFSDLDCRCSKKFKGRTTPHYAKESMTAKEYAEFKENGIFAYEWRGNKITPILLTAFAPTVKEWKARMKPGVCGDFTDDSGMAFSFSGGHHHPFSPDVFPLSALAYAEIPKDVVEKIKKNRDSGF